MLIGEGTVEIFPWFADNVAAGYFALSPTNDYASDDFSTQLVAGFSGSCVNDQYIYAEDFEFAMAPWIASADEAFYTAWNRGPIFLKASDEAIDRGAYEFVKFFLSPEVNAGWAQVNGCRGETKELYQMEDRIRKDIWYVENWSFWLDLRIIYMTVRNAVRGEANAY